MKSDDVEEAGRILREVNPFPELTSRLCDCDRQCQGHCVRGIKGEPVQIQTIERYIADHTKRQIVRGEANGRKAALIGTGSAALAAGVDLLAEGWQVEYFEKLDRIGGAIYSGIPSYRFDKKYLDEIQADLAAAGAVFHFSCEIGKDMKFDALVHDFDRVLLAPGAQVENTYGLGGDGCEAGLSLLYHLNVEGKHEAYQKKYRGAIVWGGGNVAMDCARSLIRILDEVTVVYRRSEKEMPANRDEIEAAEKEGVKFAFLTNIVELYHDENNRVTGAHLVKMHLGEPDSSGRARPIVTEGSDYDIPCELVVPAIGQKVDLERFGIESREKHGTNMPHVFVAGDALFGPSTVAACIHDGREAAKEMMED
jgi:NADPH-dependent glutamate synthase beta subunit-like oxidoreductase